MFGEILYLQKAQPYKIRNRKTRNLITAGLEIKADQEANCNEQIWLLSEVKPEQYEIVLLKSGEVISYNETGTNGLYELKLEKGKRKDNQLWSLFRAQIVEKENYFWIRPIKNNSLFLCASGFSSSCKVQQMDSALGITLWSFEPVNEKESVLNNTTFIKSELSELVIDIPEATLKDGSPLIQWSLHGGGNQRWMIEKAPHQSTSDTLQYVIRSFSSYQVITVGAPVKEGGKVYQSIYCGGTDQKWQIIKLQKDFHMIRCISNPNFYLAASNTKEGGSITLTMDVQKCKWIMENAQLIT